MKYTLEQERAIRHRDGNLQILACAGSGKTEVISKRLAMLVSEGVPRTALVAFTFTERAADEMKARIRTHLEDLSPDDPALGDMYVGTIHSYCLQLLKAISPKFRRYEVMDEARHAALLMSNFQYFPKTQNGIGLDKLRSRTRTKGYWDTIRTFLATINVIHQKNIPLSKIDDPQLVKCIQRYQRIAYGEPNYFFDFDQIISRLIDELRNDPDFLDRLRMELEYLVVDEYQDVDDRQEELIALLSNNGRDVHVTVVGDDDQAIYGWRGARIDNILGFVERYPNVTQIKLTDNFRSTHAITEIADGAIQRIPARYRISKDMVARHWDPSKNDFVETMARHKDVQLRTLDAEEEEALWVADRIQELRGVLISQPDGTVRGIDYADMAILLRSVRGSGKIFSDELQRHDIPVVVRGVGGLFSYREVQLIQATFCLLARSDLLLREEDGIRRLGEIEIRDLIRDHILYLRDESNSMPDANEARYLRWVAAKREELDRRNLERERRGRLARRIYPQDIFQEMLHELGCASGPSPWQKQLLHNMGRLSGLIADYETVHQWLTPNSLGSLCLFLGGWAANQVDEGGLEEAVTTNAVQIMTVHAAKGLEWPVVFVPRVSSSNFPSSLRNRGPATFLSPHLFDPNDYASGDDGERRLWYVALTRCRRFLNVTSPDRKGKRPTDFYREIEHDYVERYDDTVNLDKGTPTPPSNAELLPTTYTELNYYWRCSFEYQLRALMGFEPGVKESYGYGHQIHNALAEIHQLARDGTSLSATQVTDLIDQRFHLRYTSDGDIYKPLSILREAAKKSISRYLHTFPDTTKFVLEAEKPFEFVDRESGALISGTVDLIQQIERTDSKTERRIPVAIVDFKAHRWNDLDSYLVRKKEVEAQLRLYSIAVGETLGFDAQRAYAHFLSPNPPSPSLIHEGVAEMVEVDVAENSLRQMRNQVRSAVDDIQERAKTGVFSRGGVQGGSCPACDFKTICPGYKEWQEADRITPRPDSPEREREREMLTVEDDLHAG